MPNATTDSLEALIRSLAEQLSQSPIERAELQLNVEGEPELLAARFEREEIKRSTHVYPKGTFCDESAPSVIDSLRIIVNGVEFHIWQGSREPTQTEIDASNAAELEHPAVTMPQES